MLGTVDLGVMDLNVICDICDEGCSVLIYVLIVLQIVIKIMQYLYELVHHTPL